MKTKITTLILLVIAVVSSKTYSQLHTNYTLGFNGIGTTTPTQKLHINGNLLLNSENRLLLGTNNPVSGHLKIVNSHAGYDTYFDYKGSLNFRYETLTGLKPAIAFQSDGTITIGVDDPWGNVLYNTQGYKLAVNGGILCEEIKVILDVPQFDIVFESDYKLSSLYEVEQYILKNKHLKDIPSAKEFREEGYKLGEMDGLLLKKTEELTLYLIQMRKELDLLKKQNEELRRLLELKQ